MRAEGNSLDLNNLPEENGMEAFDASSPSTDTNRFKKKSGGKDDSYKVYECRFCSLKFCKSQALGGHMNRHRQEREVETLNRARQIVFTNEGLTGAVAHMGLRDTNYGVSRSISLGEFQHACNNTGDPFRPVYPNIPPTHPPPLRSYICPSSSSHSNPYIHTNSVRHPSARDYFNGHEVRERPQHLLLHQHCVPATASFVTCFGVPLANTLQMDGVQAQTVRDSATSNNKDARKWSCSYGDMAS